MIASYLILVCYVSKGYTQKFRMKTQTKSGWGEVTERDHKKGEGGGRVETLRRQCRYEAFKVLL